MDESKKYKKASFCYLIGNFFNKGLAFLTIPIFTRLLSTTDYGIINTYSSWAGILSMIVGFAMHMSIRNAFVDYKDDTESYLSTIIKFTLLSSLGFMLIFYAVVKIFRINISLSLVFICLFHSVASSIIEDVSCYFMMKYNYIKRTILMILPNLISVCVAIFLISYILKKDLYLGKIIPEALTIIIFAIILSICYTKKGFNTAYIKHALKISLPLILHGAALNILSNSDRIMITWLADASQAGIYSLVYSLGMVTYAITLSIDGIWIPWFTNKMKEKSYDEINYITKDYIKLITYIMCGLIIVSPEILKILASKSYWEGIKLIPIIIVANFLFFAYNIYSNLEHYYKKSNQITALTILAAVLNLVLNYIFIPKFGYVAAAFTTAISYFVVFILHSIYSKTLNSNIFSIKMFILPIIEIFIFCALFYLLTDHAIIRWAVAVIYFCTVAFIQRDKIMTVLLPTLKGKFGK
ncbi:oligosaccharide flippase family protein [uncultured Eubacterium sp.]|uniref:oligosaccharide flippase family protein n=1 Tax=uncultured Eubacterium sp. TaxID=165185 RepID=UPI0025E6558C|nr:oligosaccharide flippase family protein [uncultured Eubacterium sp.]